MNFLNKNHPSLPQIHSNILNVLVEWVVLCEGASRRRCDVGGGGCPSLPSSDGDSLGLLVDKLKVTLTDVLKVSKYPVHSKFFC
jgi:hypothetical protein